MINAARVTRVSLSGGHPAPGLPADARQHRQGRRGRNESGSGFEKVTMVPRMPWSISSFPLTTSVKRFWWEGMRSQVAAESATVTGMASKSCR
jgi:hypothetical protein